MILQAHPWGPLSKYEDTLWQSAFVLGIDSPMTPFTADMTLPETSDPHSRRVYVEYYAFDGHKNIFIEDLPLLTWRVPLHLFLEEYYAQTATPGVIYALCYGLEKIYGPGYAFTLRIGKDKEQLKEYGFNTPFACTYDEQPTQ